MPAPARLDPTRHRGAAPLALTDRSISILVALFLFGCNPTMGGPGATTAAGRAAAGQGGSQPRLGAVSWPTVDSLIFCSRRIDDLGNTFGVAGPCWRLRAEQKEAKRILSWEALARFDASDPARGPWPRCKLELQEAQVVPTPSPARAWLVGPSGRTLLEEWTPDPEAAGDRFLLELSFSPEGKWMAVVRVAVGLGEGERTVEIPSAAIRPVPACP